MLPAALTLFVALCALEWLFWLSPLTPRIQRAFRGFHYYGLRLVALSAVLFLWRPSWHPFAGHWAPALLTGFLLCLLVAAIMVRQMGGGLGANLAAWWQEDRRSFLRESIYILLGPALVEELLWRWFFVAAATGLAGWHALWAVPLLNLLWHLPVWWRYAEGNREALWAMAAPATVLAFLLTAMTYNAPNLAGVIAAHWLGDWLGQIARYQRNRKQAA